MLVRPATPRRRALLAASGAAVLLAVLAVVAVSGDSGARSTGAHGSGDAPPVSAPPATSPAATPPAPPYAAPPVDPASARQVAAQLAGTEDVPAGTSTQYPGLSGLDRSQPDLFAAAFFTELFTRDYAGSSRRDLLSWVQANTGIDQLAASAALPEDLLPRASTFTLTTEFGVIPAGAEWHSLASFRGVSSVDRRTVRVTTPPDAQQKIIDGSAPPGFTEKLVTATVGTRTVVNGHPVTHAASVALSMSLVGPPNRADWALNIATRYTSVAVS